MADILARVDNDDGTGTTAAQGGWMTNVTAFNKPQEVWMYVFWKIHERLQMPDPENGSTSGAEDKDSPDPRIRAHAFRHRLQAFRKRLNVPPAVFGGFRKFLAHTPNAHGM